MEAKVRAAADGVAGMVGAAESNTHARSATAASVQQQQQPPSQNVLNSQRFFPSLPLTNRYQCLQVPDSDGNTSKTCNLDSSLSLAMSSATATNNAVTSNIPQIQNSMSPWISAGQRTPKNKQKPTPCSQSSPPLMGSPEEEVTLSLPSISGTHTAVPSHSNNDCSEFSRQKSNSPSEVGDIKSFKELFISLLPIIIKLFITSNITEKIECFIEIGNVLKVDGLVSSILDNLALTSLSSQ
jgi:hypothetical protein